ncbi:MAG: hypothetical protein ACREKF_00845 [Candidatus Methylomirabilales bacterium]
MPARPKKPKDRTDPLTRPKVRAAAGARLRASVVIVEGPGAGQEYLLEKAVSVLGRERERTSSSRTPRSRGATPRWTSRGRPFA